MGLLLRRAFVAIREVPSRTSSAVFLRLLTAAQRACGSDEAHEYVVEAGLCKGNLVLFVRGGEALELSLIGALTASHGPDIEVLQESPRQYHGTNFPPRDQSFRPAEERLRKAWKIFPLSPQSLASSSGIGTLASPRFDISAHCRHPACFGEGRT